jgi:hypothetical protein
MNPTQNHCPGVGEYGHGLTARVVHLGCCTDGPAIEIASRRFDGKPETEADRRLFELRESGYTGWIDQDGYPADGPTFVRTDPTAELVNPGHHAAGGGAVPGPARLDPGQLLRPGRHGVHPGGVHGRGDRHGLLRRAGRRPGATL